MLIRAGLVALLTAIVEIWLMVRVASWTDPATTVLLLVLLSAGGAWIVKREGLAALRRLQGNLRASTFPTSDVVDGFLILVAGALLLPPGFLTGFLGLLLVVPPIRRLVGRWLSEALRVRIATRIGSERAAAGARVGSWAWRAYRRPDEPGGAPPGAHHGDVLDVDGEEVDVFGGAAELGPPRGE
jgi:UPF0716 protein FxsA